jgi:hypothetical protein
MIRLHRLIGAVTLLMLTMQSAAAQVPWETPSLIAPHSPRGVSVLAASFAAAPGDGMGVVLAWRRADAPTGPGFRIAAGQGLDGEVAVGAGVEASSWIARSSAAFPLDVIWASGIGGSYGRSAQVALPIGVAFGRSLGEESVWFSPYAAARAVIEAHIGGNAPDGELDLQLATEVGANMSFDRERRFVLRMAAAIGDRSALAIGAHIGAGARGATRALPVTSEARSH